MYYFATVLFILLSANGTFLPFFNIDWFIIEFIYIWIAIEYNRFSKRDLKIFGNFAIIYLCYCTLRSLFLTHLTVDYYISDVIFLFKYILPSFLYCALLKDKAIYYLSRVIIDGALLSVPLFLIQLVAGDMLYSLGKSLAIPPVVEGYSEYTNFVFFIYTKAHSFQNSGFAWEPGGFGFFLNVGLLLHFLSNGFTFDKRAKWMVLIVITTMSTTSFIALIIVFLLFFRARGMKFNKLLLFAVPIFFIMVFQLPFLADKIIFTYKSDLQNLKNIDALSAYYIMTKEQFALNRFASLLFIYKLFGPQLIWGVSNIYTETQPILKNINISNGIFEFSAKFGFIGLTFLLYRAYLFFRAYTNNFEQAFYCIILILILGFGEAVFILPITTTFYFLYKYTQPEEDEEVNEDELILT